MSWYTQSQIQQWIYVGNCVSLDAGDFINFLTDNAKEISYRTMKKAIPDFTQEHPYPDGIPLSKDWSVSFWKSRTPSGIPVYFFDHSSIEFIFVPRNSGFDVEKEEKLARDYDDDEDF